jgi:hypothetical protein
MKFDTNLSSIHGYLCGDGYVIKNPKTQKHKYYHIGYKHSLIVKDGLRINQLKAGLLD